MTTNNYPEINTPARQAAINGLAAVGFIALVGAGIWLAMYSTRYVPTAANRIGAAAVYLGSIFTPAPDEPALSVVPTPAASTTIAFSEATSTPDTASVPTSPSSPSPAPRPASVQTVMVQTAVQPYGLPDLAVQVTTVGYLTSASTDSFIATSSVPSGNRPAVKFTIKNIGTNWSGTWRFTASIPTRRTYTFQSEVQQSLAPNESIDYTLGFDQAATGSNQTITITANVDRAVPESNYNNDSATATITIQ